MSIDLATLAFNWRDLEAAGSAARKILLRLADDSGALHGLIDAAAADPTLGQRCRMTEHGAQALLYHAPERGVVLMLCVGEPVDWLRPHEHPWSYSAVTLRGEFRQVWIDRRSSAPFMTRIEAPGSCYTLHRSMLHLLQADATFATLLLAEAAPAVLSSPTDETARTYAAARDVIAPGSA